MKKKTAYTLNAGDQEYEDMEGEENGDNTATTSLLYDETERCPICLNCLLEKEVGFPESCNHVFCMACILKWAETLASCPIDRKPFQAVLKFSALEGCVKVQVKRQLRETKDKKNEGFLTKQLSCYESCKGSVRRKITGREDLSARVHDLRIIHGNSSHRETGGKKNAVIKINKPRRANQHGSRCFRNFFSNIFSSNCYTGESSLICQSYCTEFIEVNEISELIRQKRRELELSWFPDTLPGIGRIGFIPWNTETEVLPLISSMLPRTIFPTSTICLENFGSSWKEYALAHTQGGEEKKQASGTSNTRGSRRKPAAVAPTRRSTRNTRVDAVSQSQKSPVSVNSGCDAPGSSNASVSASSSAEPEKPTRQAPKRKPVRRGRKPPLSKKKLRSSIPPPEKASSGDSVDEEAAESDTPPVLEKEHQSDTEKSACTVQTNTESQSAVFLESRSEQIEDKEHTEDHDTEEKVESPHSESCTQDPAVLVGEEEKEMKKLEDAGAEANVLCVESEVSEHTSGKGGDGLENPDQTSGPSAPELKAGACADNCECSGSKVEVHQPVFSPLGELSKNAEAVVNEKVIQNAFGDTVDQKDSPVKQEELMENPTLESSVDEIMPAGDKKSIESALSSELECTGDADAERTAACDTAENEGFGSLQDSENNLLQNNLNTELDKSLKEKTESLVEHPTPVELPDTQIEKIEKHFSEDNNEMIPMECDSFCSDQNEPEIEPSVNVDSRQLDENSLAHSSESNVPSADAADGKVDMVPQPSESSVDATEKARKPRTRRSRFHSPSTTWSPSKDSAQEKKRSQSPSPKRETGKENRTSQSPSPKKESARGRRKSRSHSPKKDNSRERRQSQSRSPKRDSTKEVKTSESLSPRRDACRENRRSRSRAKDSSPREKSRSRSRERESDRDGQRRDRDRERRSRRWSGSRSRSRSPSRSRTKSKSSSFGRNDRDDYSPRWKERWTNDGWRCPRGSGWYRKSDPEKQSENTRKERNDLNPDVVDPSCTDKHRNDCPNWVTEKINSRPDPRTRNPEKLKDSHWEESRNENSGSSWNRNFGSGWMPNRGRGHRGRGTFRGGFAYADQSENRWQNRKPLSGNSNSSGNESFKFAEQQSYKRKSEQEFSFDTPADRSGWTSASSWAVRKTLPADVQNYYSRRGRNSSGPQSAWIRQEEEAPDQDSNLKDQTGQQVDGSQLSMTTMQPPMQTPMQTPMPPQMGVVQPPMGMQPPPVNMFPYPVGVPAPLMSVQRSPFPIHPQLPVHLHTGVPLLQVAAPAAGSQGPPPPPPPPPPTQQMSYMASQPEGKQLQGIPNASHVSNNMSTPVLPAPPAAPANVGTVQGPSAGNTSSSSHGRASNAAVKLAESKVSVTVEASADSSKTDKKLQIQEKAAQEVKLAIKPFYQNKDITKEEYKEIVRKAVDKVCHSKSGEVNSTKVANLVKAYVDKYKYSRKGSQKKTLEEPVSTEKNIG
nr:protein SCAF11 isoform X2 [Oryctolagus cuniculus]XP_051706956.1 protein SCAF11 isoform X2 [Oryctolagus cuniculus]XP_051706957.1 protein SCAF11 isoform X2 [Oryctolagus cuniculus]